MTRSIVHSLGVENRFAQAMADLKRMAIRESLPIAVVGGLAAIHYGYAVSTQDIDIVVGLADLDRLLHAAPNYGFKIAWRAKTNWHTLTHGDVEINVVPEGGRSHAHSPTTIPGPARLGVSTGMEYASFPPHACRRGLRERPINSLASARCRSVLFREVRRAGPRGDGREETRTSRRMSLEARVRSERSRIAEG